MYPRQRGGIRVTTIHDLVPLRHPEWAQRRTVAMHAAKYRNAATTCDLIFANSRFTAGEVVELLGVPEERIRVAYPGLDPVFSAEGPRAGLGGPYVLAVATLEPRKNLPALVEAFSLLRRRRRELRLAVVGASGWGKLPPLGREGVELLGYVEDERLAELYRGASVFAYPSLFEGFGMPVAEALASGVPAVVSSHPSLDEASGDAALRAAPGDAEAFADALDRAFDTPAETIERGRRHAALFTWAAAGRALLAGYENAL